MIIHFATHRSATAVSQLTEATVALNVSSVQVELLAMANVTSGLQSAKVADLVVVGQLRNNLDLLLNDVDTILVSITACAGRAPK